MKDLKKMTIEEMELLRSNIYAEINRRHQQELVERTLTREDLIEVFSAFGFLLPKGSVFWRVKEGENRGLYGFEVGRYTHSCYIETTDFVVLLLYVPNYHTQVKEFDDLSLEKAFVV
jgi:hypothetical protein